MCLGDPSLGRRDTLHTYGRIHSDLVIRIPESLSIEISPGLPVIYGTVIYSSGHISQIGADKIWIHAAAGGIVQAVIQYARIKRSEVFMTLSSMISKEFIM